VDEEGGGNGTLACIANGVKADAAVVLDPTSLTPYLGHMGWLFFRILVTGRSVHSSIKWKGVSAIEKAQPILNRLSDLEDHWAKGQGNPLFPLPTINIGQITAGTAGSVVPDSCEIKLCLHFPPDGDAQQGDAQRQADLYEAQVREAVNEVVAADQWLSVNPPVVEKYQQGDPFSIRTDDSFAQVVLRAVAETFGEEPARAGAPYGCDARLLSVSAGLPTVIFGPGSIEQAHAADEFLDIEQYLKAIKATAAVILEWARL
jgi:acetylornithine deacetylase